MKQMETLQRTKIKALLASEPGVEVLAKGWVRTKRGNKQVKFIALNDGSTINNIQIVANTELFDEELLKRVTTGASLAVKGKLVASMGSGQAVEIQADEIEVLGDCDPMRFPLQKKDTTLEYRRSVAHMRLRTNTFGAVLRIRNAIIPIITAIGMQFSYVMTGSALAETVFGWPGIGRLVVDSINKRDTPMVTGSIILCCVLMAVINLAVDIIYAFCDPRIKAQYSGKG